MTKYVAQSLLLIVLTAAGSHAQDKSPDETTKREEATTSADPAADSQKAAAAEVQRFTFAFADNREAKLKLHTADRITAQPADRIPVPILRYTNPLRGEV